MATVKVKAKGAQAVKLAKAFGEVNENTPTIVKHTARKFGKARAEKQRQAIAFSKAGMSKPNFVTPDAHYVLGVSPSPAKRGRERLTTGDDPAGNHPTGVHDRPTNAQYVAHAFPAVNPDQPTVNLQAREVQPVNKTKQHSLPDSSPEMIRRRNNLARDLRTNLGKARPMTPVADE